MLSAVAERATITTLTNVEGKSLTEVTLRVRNHAQPFVKVELPAGAQLLSAEVEGERVKPVLDGWQPRSVAARRVQSFRRLHGVVCLSEFRRPLR